MSDVATVRQLAAFYRSSTVHAFPALTTCSHPVPLARSIDGCPILPLVRSLNANSIRDEGAIVQPLRSLPYCARYHSFMAGLGLGLEL